MSATKSFQIDAQHLAIVKEILHKHIPEREVWAFGSRVHGHNLKRFSDLDLVIAGDQPINPTAFVKLKHDFSQSDLPFRVDLVLWYAIDDSFKKVIEQNYVIIKQSER